MINKAVTVTIGMMSLVLTILGLVAIVSVDKNPVKAAGAQFSPAVKPPNTSPTAADPAQVVVLGPNSTGILTVSDPCTFQAKSNKQIATAAGTFQIVAPVVGQQVFICSYHITNAAAAVMNLIEGTGATCTTANESAIIGNTTAALGESKAANGDITIGNGSGTVGFTAFAGNGVCLLQSGTAAIAGNVTYVQQ